eukprot:CAMPEP_0168330516 /NCGR_PEP_ID=MMETSP0213-20121227/7787_1 /TAXON_ID=151035 /ORGANISM="Euplotes harpa, Strain FSP1.4" /LENGTH=120 /DNA_ID=CAMNT_0008334121 /DNA_START=7 /DNA_END=369 /DNA_ORIENTATION=+
MGSILSNCDLQLPQTSYASPHKIKALNKYFQEQEAIKNSRVLKEFNPPPSGIGRNHWISDVIAECEEPPTDSEQEEQSSSILLKIHKTIMIEGFDNTQEKLDQRYLKSLTLSSSLTDIAV